MDANEIRLRCIEAAARAPMVHAEGPAAGVIATARSWFDWIVDGRPSNPDGREVLGLPKKK